MIYYRWQGTIYSANIAAEKYNKQMVALDSLLRSLDLVSTMTEPSTSNHNILLGAAIIKQDREFRGQS